MKRTVLDIYEIMNEVRNRIIQTMQERGLTKVNLVMTLEEFAKENGYTDEDEDFDNFESDYQDYKNQESPYVTYWDKWGHGVDYSVTSVELVKSPCGEWQFKLECYEDENGEETFYDYEVSRLTMINVYGSLEIELGLRETA